MYIVQVHNVDTIQVFPLRNTTHSSVAKWQRLVHIVCEKKVHCRLYHIFIIVGNLDKHTSNTYYDQRLAYNKGHRQCFQGEIFPFIHPC